MAVYSFFAGTQGKCPHTTMTYRITIGDKKLLSEYMNDEYLVSTMHITDTNFCIAWHDHRISMASRFLESILKNDMTNTSLTIGNILSEFSLNIDANFLSKCPDIFFIRIFVSIIISFQHIICLCLSQSREFWIYNQKSPSECCTDCIHMVDNIGFNYSRISSKGMYTRRRIRLQYIPYLSAYDWKIEVSNPIFLNRFDQICPLLTRRKRESNDFSRKEKSI